MPDLQTPIETAQAFDEVYKQGKFKKVRTPFHPYDWFPQD